nr:retrovirus-related Pol polyprotein from transposon TNT 1-94 [Tanacetum cinerariifolium]
MTGNRSYLIDYKEIDGGFFAFRGNSKGGKITKKGKIRTDFKLTDESHVLLKVPRKDNMYSVDLKNVVPKREGKTTQSFLTPQQNGVAESKNRSLIEAARTMLVDSKLPTTFGAEAFNTACYMVLVIKPHNKILYEIFLGRKSALSFMRPFRYPVIILNTIDHLGKFNGKADEGFFVGYSTNSKAFRVFNDRTRIVEENLHVKFSKNTPNIAGSTKVCDNVGKTRVETVPDKDYILLPLWTQDPPFSSSSKDSLGAGFKPSGEEEKKDDEDLGNEDSEDPSTEKPRVNQEKDANVNNTNNINIVSPSDNVAGIEDNVVDENIVYRCANDLNIPDLEEIGRFGYAKDDDSRADMNNLDTYFQVRHVPTTRIHKDHPLNQIIGDLQSATQTRQMTKNLKEYGWMSKVLFYGKIEEEVYVCQPHGFEDIDFPDRVYKVEKAFYGLHQALRSCDYAGASLDRKSTTVGFQFLDCRLIPWQCKKQTVVANSITEVEYVAASSCCGQVLWIQNQLLNYRKKVIITEATIRRDLYLKDAEAVDCLPNAEIFEQLTLMGFVQVFLDKQVDGMSKYNAIYVIPSHTKKVFGNMKRVGKGFSSRETPLFPTMMVQTQEDMGEPSAHPTDPHHTPTITQPSTSKPQKKQKPKKPRRQDTKKTQSSGPTTNVEDEVLMRKMFLNIPMIHCIVTAQAHEIDNLKRRVKKLERRQKSKTHRMKRLVYLQKWNPLMKRVWVRKSKTHRMKRLVYIKVESSDEESLEDQGRFDDQEMFDTGVLDDEKGVVEKEVVDKEVSVVEEVNADSITTFVSAAATTTTAAITPTISMDEITLAKVLIEIKTSRPKAKGIVMQEPSETPTPTPTPIVSSKQPSKVQDKGKGIMVKPRTPLKKKAQISLDEELASKQQAKEEKEQERIRLQAEEQEQLTDVEKDRLFMEFLEKRKKFFAAKRAEEKINRPPTQAQQRSLMYTYLKNMDGWKSKALKSKSFVEIQKLFDKAMARINNFIDFRTALVEESTKKDKNTLYYLLAEKMYPLTHHTLYQMFNDVKLQIDYECEMAYELLRLVKKQLKKDYVPE